MSTVSITSLYNYYTGHYAVGPECYRTMQNLIPVLTDSLI